ncbi:Acyl-coenzyme A dehydrogenase [Acinetobacter oleivorans]|nr:Acyl-coenzyme A dehydrogenase [Acinetobacter oleivorans]CAI3129360.1 Acyl-coenzyme A dehydrogenase [Acinetobacter oleivorans]CAI3129368.1 Acyl-coenzyme A dehydrogenase [Acinetobacter oleivorans]CAI3129439.1 Acyl-coenzyme A dehydrogenase [Acinetobacter oleivorans]CAI3129505.1 Acyl-coenzyme A dehydrogenase [Acinetobacter oleivorans]
MIFLLFVLSIVIQLFAIWAIFFFNLNRIIGSVITIAVAIFTALILTPWALILGIPLIALSIIILFAPLRFNLITKPAYKTLANSMPSISTTEQEALEAGTSWWEKELFMGAPDWSQFENYPYPTLSEEEQSFIDNEVELLCSMLNEWEIHHHLKDLPPEVWQFIKDKGFLGLIIPKSFGGKEFSSFAQSRIMSKIASRSLTTAVSCMVPNSLGPGELLMHYGTDAQKQQYLPGLAKGEEIPCFGLTSPEAGSDAGAIPDSGVVCYGEHEGAQVLGLRMNFSKRWITLAPIATVVGLAFKLYDPEGLLGDKNKTEYGITCALIPASHAGVKIGARHFPGSPFMNGTVEGEDVFIPIDWIIGGQENAGKGWRMLMECLGVGRGISLPALATAAGEMSYLTVGAFAKIRQQFNISVGKFEGVQEATSEIASDAYMLEAFRYLVTCGLNQGGTPAVMTAMAKYYATETMRKVVNHGMDIAGGRAIQLGPRNFLALTYQAIPIAITVEGANILTRSLMIFGQGSMRCHPYLFEELQLLQSEDKANAVQKFDDLLFKHLAYTFNRGAKSFAYGWTSGSNDAPQSVDQFTASYYKTINRFSANFALVSDMSLGLLAGDLKRKEMLSGRLADIHAHLFISTAILKFYEAGQKTEAEQLHAKLALQKAFLNIQEAFWGLFENFPAKLPATFVKWICFPLGRVISKPDDELKQQVAELMMQEHPFREQLKHHVFYSTKADDVTGRLEHTFQILRTLEPLWDKFKKAESKGKFTGLTFEENIAQAIKEGFITESEAQQLLQYNAIRFDSMLTDVFDKDLNKDLPLSNPHQI